MAKSKTQPIGYFPLESFFALKVRGFLQDKLNQTVVLLKVEQWVNVMYVCFYQYKEYPEHGKYQQRFVSYKVLNSDKPEQSEQPEQPEQQILPNTNTNLDGHGRGRKPVLTEKKFQRELKRNFSASKKFYSNNTSKMDKIIEQTFLETNLLEGVPDENIHKIKNLMKILKLISEVLKTSDIIQRKKVETLNTSKKLIEFLEYVEKEARELTPTEIDLIIYKKKIF